MPASSPARRCRSTAASTCTELRRRLLLAASAAAIPVVALAQDRKKIVVGLLSWWPPFMEPTYVARLREGLKAYGYVEGRNLELLVTFTGGNVERTREAAKAYVDRGVDVIVATATPAVTIAKQATEAKKIPIVMTPASDPIATGFAASIARPGGHLTGMSMVGPDLSGKRLGFLREIMPDLKSVAFIGWTRDQNAKTFVAGIETAAAQLGIKLVVKMVDAPSEIDDKLMAAGRCPSRRRAADLHGPPGSHHRCRPDGQAADRQRLSGLCAVRRSFHLRIDDRAQMQRAAYFIDRIAKGANPADLPIELPTDYVLIVNQKTAAEFGLAIPPTMLQAATEVIE